jgi:hypothetical protein
MILKIILVFLALEILATAIALPLALLGDVLWLGRFLLGVALLPFRTLGTGLRLGRNITYPLARWRMLPLAQKNMTRATFGGFLVALALGAAAAGIPFQHPGGAWAVAGAGSLGLLYLTVGIFGSQGARFDVMSVFWWSALGLGCAAVLLHFEGVI